MSNSAKPAAAILALLAAGCQTPAASAMKVEAIPGGSVFVSEANPGKGYYDVMVETILLHNDGDGPATLRGLQIDLMGANGEVLSKSLTPAAVIAKTGEFAGMAEQGLEVFFNAQILNEDGLEGVFGEGARLGKSAALAPKETLITTAQYFASDFAPSSIAVTAVYADEDDAVKSARYDIAVRRREQTIDYIAPLDGNWLMRAFPNVFSHHRFIPSNEFALDFFKTGPDGALDHGQKMAAEDDYGYGDPVRAVADGEVVFVIDGEVQNPEALTRRDGESVNDARARITQYQFRRFSENFRAAAAGNLVTIRHEKGGIVEYSSYGHLSRVDVKKGDRVRQGDTIGAVGNTGDSTLTHLHFQLNEGPDAFHSRSLPVSFSNARPLYRGQDPGLFMVFGE